MSAETAIQSALNARLASLPYAPPVAWPNKSFDPKGTPVWLDVDHLPRETDAPMLGDTSSQDYGGIYQIAVMTEAGGYESDALEWADNIAAHFQRGSIGGGVRVRKVSRAAGYQSGSYWRVPVSVYYRVIL